MCQVSETNIKYKSQHEHRSLALRKHSPLRKADGALIPIQEAPGDQLVLSADLSHLLEVSQHKNLCYVWLKETDQSTKNQHILHLLA